MVMTVTRAAAPPQLLSAKELAELLQVPVTTLYYWRHYGGGPRGIRVGKYIRYDPADVAAWIRARKAAS
jgi:predicted DNA-binding transcriptional regulator AlpA